MEYNRFFAGDLQQPPTALRDEIEAEMRRLRAINMRRSRRRLPLRRPRGPAQQLRARCTAAGVRDAEEGKVAPRRADAGRRRRAHDVDAGVVIDAAQLESDAVEALFQGLRRSATRAAPTWTSTPSAPTSSARWRRSATRPAAQAVQFRVVNEEGKVKLKAKPVGAAGG